MSADKYPSIFSHQMATRVCSKQSYFFAFDKASFYPWRVARGKMGILKGFRRLVVRFDV